MANTDHKEKGRDHNKFSWYFWMKYFCKVPWVWKGHESFLWPSKTPSETWRYDGALCQMQMASGAAEDISTEILHHLLSLPRVTSPSKQWYPLFGQSVLSAGTSLSNERNFGWWEGLSQQGTLMGHWGQLVRKWEWNSHRTQMQNNTPEGRLYTMFILQWPFCCSVISPSLLSKLVTQKKESWCVKEEKIFFSLKLWNILAEQYLNVNTNVFWCTEKSIIIRNHSCYCIS